jgi:hypothetical protein
MAKAPSRLRAVPAARRGALTRRDAGRSLGSTIRRQPEMIMRWKTPVVIEVALGLKTNAYACAGPK